MKHFSWPAICLLILLFSQCKNREGLPIGEPGNGGLSVPDSFDVVVVAESTGRARHIAVNTNGDVYVKLRSPAPKGVLALRDEDNDGKADVTEVFGDYTDEGEYGTGMRIYNGYIYFTTAGEVYRMKLTEGDLVPDSKEELIMKDDYKNDPNGYEHIAKPITFDNDGYLYFLVRARGVVCQELDMIPGAPVQGPCLELEVHGGVWQFDAIELNQNITDGKWYGAGIRSIVLMDWNHSDITLYAL